MRAEQALHQRQTQKQALHQQQLQRLELLQMGALELESYIQELAMTNPLVEPAEDQALPAEGTGSGALSRLQWLEENDRQNLYYQHIAPEELDPLANVGTGGGLEETLVRFLSRQLTGVQEDKAQMVRYLAACLDADGYLRCSLEELHADCGIPLPLLEEGLALLRSLEPAGVGARDLSDCLALQLLRIGERGPALAIVQTCLEAMAKGNDRAIAGTLGISLEEVRAAERIVRQLEPRPGAIFQRSEQVPYIVPDIFILEEGGVLQVRSRREGRPPFHMNSYYVHLLEQSEDQEVRTYLSQKLRQAEEVLRAVGDRETTLVRCAQAILDRQDGFFRRGPAALAPLRLADVAEMLELHPSTVSRALREKYLQCAHGVFPMSFFFSHAAREGTSAAAVQALLRQIVQKETSPLSDQALCEHLAQAGYPISRRTVAKYREQLGIPSAAKRGRRTCSPKCSI